jgi:hypothetical protein
MAMATRRKTRKDYKKINEYGFDEQSDILDISDPASGMLDTEIEGEGLQGQLEALKLDITNTEKEIIQDEKKWKKLYDSQGGKPMVVVAKAKSSTPLKDTRKIVKLDDSEEVKPGKSRSSRGKSEQKKRNPNLEKQVRLI